MIIIIISATCLCLKRSKIIKLYQVEYEMEKKYSKNQKKKQKIKTDLS